MYIIRNSRNTLPLVINLLTADFSVFHFSTGILILLPQNHPIQLGSFKRKKKHKMKKPINI